MGKEDEAGIGKQAQLIPRQDLMHRRATSRRAPRLESSSRLTFSQSLWTSISESCLQAIKPSIHPSSVPVVVGSSATGEMSLGTRPTSSIAVSILYRIEGVWNGGRREMDVGCGVSFVELGSWSEIIARRGAQVLLFSVAGGVSWFPLASASIFCRNLALALHGGQGGRS